jgi:hypothetical protein
LSTTDHESKQASAGEIEPAPDMSTSAYAAQRMLHQKGPEQEDKLSSMRDRPVNPHSYPVNSFSLISYLIPDAKTGEKVEHISYFLVWPPNLFAFTSLFFSLTGAYAMVTDEMCSRENWQAVTRETALLWQHELEKFDNFDFLKVRDVELWKKYDQYVPESVRKDWETVVSVMEPTGEGDVLDIWDKHKEVFLPHLRLHAIADQVCLGWGIREFPRKHMPAVRAARAAVQLLDEYGTLATIHPNRARVLPKRHTPQVGVTLRSVSSNLAFHHSSIKVNWEVKGPSLLQREASDEDRAGREKGMDPRESKFAGEEGASDKLANLNLLLLPWPLSIRTVDFCVGPRPHADQPDTLTFRYAPADGERDKTFETDLRSALAHARGEVGAIDAVILPECAITRSQIDVLERVLKDQRDTSPIRAYIAGVRSQDEKNHFRNQVYFGFLRDLGADYKRFIQDKHHRWRLDPLQIRNYQLGGRLHPSATWWEDIPIGRRQVHFVNFGPELTVCPLICEDLARQDPIADLIRAVGPSLVVAILLDGPQLSSRWGARYASVLADDPGSSVVALTSIGMVNRFSTPIGPSGPIVGLWSDRTGMRKELRLDENAIGIVLSLAVEPKAEGTLDGRRETHKTHTLTYGGMYQVPRQRETSVPPASTSSPSGHP